MIGILLLAGCAPSMADALAQAQAPGLSIADALAACTRAGDQAAPCATEVVRRHPESTVDDCASIGDERWRAECAFAVAERHARGRRRWDALAACGLAGRYYHECLYHAWTYEMQAAVTGGRRANDELAAGRGLVAFWGQLQTLGGDPLQTLWGDWWYFALNRNQPASLTECAALGEDDAARCARGTGDFVERAVATSLRDGGLNERRKSRVCRGGIEEVELVFPGLYLPDDTLRARALAGRDRGCATVRGIESGRPWNPLFLEHRTWHAG